MCEPADLKLFGVSTLRKKIDLNCTAQGNIRVKLVQPGAKEPTNLAFL